MSTKLSSIPSSSLLKRLLTPLFGLAMLFTALSAQKLPQSRPEEMGVSTARLNNLRRVINQAVVSNETPGAVVLVARHGRIIFREAFGVRSIEPREEAMSVDSIFDAASMTKVMATATSVMILVEEGRLALSDKVADVIPEFARRGKGDVSILQLLTHHSGLRPDLDLYYSWSGYEKAIDLACRERLVSDPGEEFIYSDINYLLLGEIVSRISRQKLEDFSAERVFQPLGMFDTGFNPPTEKLGRVVPTEKRDGRLLRGEVHDPTANRMGGCAGHAGLFSTVDDTAIWAQMLLNGGIAVGVRILSPLGALKMTTPQSPAESLDWRGIGFDLQTRFSTVRGDLFPVGSFGHTGFTGTSVWIDPYTETLVVLFTNRLHPNGEGDVRSLRSRVASVVAASLVDIPINRDQYFKRF